ncbi:MAG: SDR family NAD(P)-dependent oxidoreductase, partial [Ignavibacteriae bacterium]|nr:SDR family NAD(P)-dependent oxidoreductase [Ignavibacteriota bacterium]
NYTSPNPKINFDETPFYVNTELSNWDANGVPRRAGVSSFGIGGTNVHVVLEQAPRIEEVEQNVDWHLLPFSAKTSKSLSNGQSIFKKYIEANDINSLRNIAYTLQTGRKHFEKRHFVVSNNKSHLLRSLSEDKKNSTSIVPIENPSVVFMFSGQGSQYVNMCKELYETNSGFQKYADECFSYLLNSLNINLKDIIFPKSDNNQETSEKLKQTEYTQPALFVVEYSLAMTLIDLGIYPQSMVGHSIGEFVAACIAGVMDLEVALTLVTKRGQLMQKLDKGSMLSVVLPEKELLELLPAELDLSVVNAPNLCVISGKENKIIEFSNLLNEKEIVNTILHTSHAFHSRMMDPILNEFKSLVESFNLNPPSIPYMSNVTGEFITDANAVDPTYYLNHLRYTVRFSENISKILEDDKALLLEVGPGSTLASLAKFNPNAKGRTIINSVKHPKQEINDKEMFLTAIGKLWLSGLEIDWNKFYDEQPYRVHLPTYCFDKKRYWLKTKSSSKIIKKSSSLYNYSSWKRKRIEPNSENFSGIKHTILIFDDVELSLTKLISNNLFVEKIISVIPGERFNKISIDKIEINPASREEYIKLIEELNDSQFIPNIIVHNWSSIKNTSSKQDFDHTQSYGYFSLVNLANAIFEKDLNQEIQVDVITSEIFDVVGNENLNPNKATILGASKVIHQEFKNLKIRTIDVECSTDFSSTKNTSLVIDEIFSEEMEPAIALRNNHRWVQFFEPLELKQSNSKKLLLENGVYVITGGLGRIGLTLAEHLTKQYNANIFLLDQTDLPPKENWKEFLNDNEDDWRNEVINRLISIDMDSSRISTLKVDVSNYDEMNKAISAIFSEHGKINGVFHAAGALGDDMIRLVYQVNEENFLSQIKTKVKATENLALILEDKKVDFVLLQSSLSAILGGLGFASYSAANCYLDSFVQSKIRQNEETKWISVNWDGWNFEERIIGSEVTAITPNQGIESFEKILTNTAPQQVIVATGNLDERINEWIIQKDVNINENDTEIQLHERPNIDSEYVEPKTDLEKQIFPEWIKLLGIEKIGINDNFFDLGGDSLIGTQLVSRMRKIFSVDIPIKAIFENATIKGIAELIEKEKNNGSVDEAKKLSNVLDLLDNISDEAAAKLLNDKNKE